MEVRGETPAAFSRDLKRTQKLHPELFTESTVGASRGEDKLAQAVEQNELNGLTPREKQVAELVLQGLSGKEICQRLWITINTLERHKTNIFRKFGIHSRFKLAEAMKQRVR